MAYSLLGLTVQAIESVQQALAIGRAIGYRRGQAVQLKTLGEIYYNAGQVEQAVDYYQQATSIAGEIGDTLCVSAWAKRLDIIGESKLSCITNDLRPISTPFIITTPIHYRDNEPLQSRPPKIESAISSRSDDESSLHHACLDDITDGILGE